MLAKITFLLAIAVGYEAAMFFISEEFNVFFKDQSDDEKLRVVNTASRRFGMECA